MLPFELFAVRYAHSGPRTQAENALGGDPHETHSSMDFYFWVAKRSDRVFLIDTGSNEATAKRRGDRYDRASVDAVQLLGLDAAKIDDVILTHLHYDHVGLADRYSRARFHLQASEMAFATGRCMCASLMSGAYDVRDVTHLIRCVYANRVTFHDQTVEITDGLSVHRVGGHTGGIQVVRVWTERGWVVVASDSSHLYYNMMRGAAFPFLHRLDETMEAFRTLHRLGGGSWDRVVPGHDPLVMQLYPAPGPGLEGIVARLDRNPKVPLPEF